MLLVEYGYCPTTHISIIHALHNTNVIQDQARLRWLLLGEYGYYPMDHISLTDALHINGIMQHKKAWLLGLLLRELGHHMTSPMSMCFVLFGTWRNTLMMCNDGVCFYWDDMTFHMSINMLLLHDPHYYVKRQQEILLLWLLLGEFGLTYSPTLHGNYGGWKEEAFL